MSKFVVPVVKVENIQKHANADSLSYVVVHGEPVVFRTSDFIEGDLAVYVPVDSVVPDDLPGLEFLGAHRRIKAKRLRGMYSEGLLLPVSAIPLQTDSLGRVKPHKVGDDVAGIMRIQKYEEPDEPVAKKPGKGSSETEKNPGFLFYDIEPMHRMRRHFEDGEIVQVTEKIHGSQLRCGYIKGKFYVSSRNVVWRHPMRPLTRTERLHNVWRRILHKPLIARTYKPNVYWTTAEKYNLPEASKQFPNMLLYGEVFGDRVQDLAYGAKPGEISLRLFDVFDLNNARWLDAEEVEFLAKAVGLEVVPNLYTGPYGYDTIAKYVEGQSTMANHVQEGVVIKPVVNRSVPGVGRLIAKWVSQGYKLRKNGTERH